MTSADSTPLSHNTLVLRMDAPLMSFGGVVIDGTHPTLRFPLRSMLAGLLANALGHERSQYDALEAVQAAFTYASRWDVEPVLMRDYQNVDMGSVKMSRKAWTSRGELLGRDSGKKDATHQTERLYWGDGVLTVVLHFSDASWVPRLAAALRAPARPLFYGRKTCVPAAPLLRGTGAWRDVLEALRAVSLSRLDAARREDTESLSAAEGGQDISVSLEVDLPQACGQALGSAAARAAVPACMDMRNRIHVGAEARVRGMLAVAVEAPAGATPVPLA